MAVTVQQLLNDAKRLVTRLREHDTSAGVLTSKSQSLNNSVETMKQYHEEVEKLNALAHQRPRSALILNIQQENRHIRELQQENRELRIMLEEHQSAIELIMNKYRQQVKQIAETARHEKAWVQRDYNREIRKQTDKIAEMVSVIKKAIEIDNEYLQIEEQNVNRLVKENDLLRDILELQSAHRSKMAQRAVLVKSDESVQTAL